MFGVGKEEDILTVSCDEGKVGQKQYKCTNSKWVILQDNCVLEDFKDLEDQSEVMCC